MPRKTQVPVGVSTTAQLMTALGGARAGDVIYLNTGTYSGVAISNFDKGGDVTIASKDPANPAVITDLRVTGSAGLTFSNLEFSFPDGVPGAYGASVSSSRDIHFLNDKVHGTLDNDPTADMAGLQIVKSSDVSVENSEFQQLRVGIVESNSSYVSILRNNFHDIRTDGVDNTGSSNVVISGNNFSHFHFLTGDHSDAIQFWTTGQTAAANNISITGNVIVQSETGRRMQGVFMGNESGLPDGYVNVNISGNLLIGGPWNGIYVDGADTTTIANNTLTSLTGQMTSVLKVFNSENVKVQNNSAALYGLDYNNLNLTSTGNITSASVADSGLATLTSWLAAHPRTVGSGPASAGALIGDEPDAISSATNYLMGEMSHRLTLTGTANIDGGGNDNGDTITGNAGNNTLTGGLGADQLNGGGGADIIVGAAGSDILTGGTGIDTFNFRPNDGDDVITDFGAGGRDVIDISNHLLDGLTPIVLASGSDTIISFANGDSIKLLGVTPLQLITTASGFLHV